MLKKIIRMLKSIIKKEEQEGDYVDDYEDGLKETAHMYEQGLMDLAKRNLDYRIYEPYWILIFKEYERQKKYRIHFEFIPPHQNFKNVRSALQYKYKKNQYWKKIRDYIEIENNSVCCICKKTSHDFRKNQKTKTECHEVWFFDDSKNIQKLVKLEPLCVFCHEIKHANRFITEQKHQEQLFKRYAEINNISLEQTVKDYQFALSERKRREDCKYSLDIKLINNFNFDCEFNEIFNCHADDFIYFLEVEFKKLKNIEIE